MPQLQGRKTADGGRLDGSIQKTTLTSSAFTLGAGWGTAPTFALTTGSTDQRGTFSITAKATPAQATATVVITFADGAFSAAPFPMVSVTSTSSIDEGHVVVTTTTTAATLTFSVLPVADKVYTFHYQMIA